MHVYITEPDLAFSTSFVPMEFITTVLTGEQAISQAVFPPEPITVQMVLKEPFHAEALAAVLFMLGPKIRLKVKG